MNHHNHEAKNLDNSLTDPVCGMAVTKASKFHEENNHTTYYFCSEKCQFKFNANPSFYITKGKETTTQESSPESPSSLIASGQQTNLTETAIYTCPMHELERDLLLTQKLITQPYFEIDAVFSDDSDYAAKSGLSELKTGIKTRYEITKRIKPFIDVAYLYEKGQKATFMQEVTESEKGWIYGAGIELVF